MHRKPPLSTKNSSVVSNANSRGAKVNPVQFFSVPVQNQLHNTKQPFSFLSTSQAPQNKPTKIDFFFKKDPRLDSLPKRDSQTKQVFVPIKHKHLVTPIHPYYIRESGENTTKATAYLKS